MEWFPGDPRSSCCGQINDLPHRAPALARIRSMLMSEPVRVLMSAGIVSAHSGDMVGVREAFGRMRIGWGSMVGSRILIGLAVGRPKVFLRFFCSYRLFRSFPVALSMRSGAYGGMVIAQPNPVPKLLIAGGHRNTVTLTVSLFTSPILIECSTSAIGMVVDSHTIYCNTNDATAADRLTATRTYSNYRAESRATESVHLWLDTPISDIMKNIAFFIIPTPLQAS